MPDEALDGILVAGGCRLLPGKVDWTVWRGIFTDPAIWNGPVSAVLARHSLTPMAVDPGFPGTSAAFAVRAKSLRTRATAETLTDPPLDLVVKFYPPMVWGDYETEVEVRTALERRGSTVPFPRILFRGILHDKIDWPYIIEEFRQGQATREVWPGMSRHDRDVLARRIAAILADLHSTPLSLLPNLASRDRNWREHALQRSGTCLGEIAVKEMAPGRCLPESLIADLGRFLEAKADPLTAALADSFFRLIHNDMTEDHVLVQHSVDAAEPWQVTGLLDYGDAKVGPVQEEWVVLSVGLFELDPLAMRVFLAEYRRLTGGLTGSLAPSANEATCPDDPVFRDTVLLLTLIHQFNAEIIAEAVRRARVDPSTLMDAQALMRVLWPTITA